MYKIIADLIVAAHLAYVGYVLVGLVLILLGMARGWQWVRNLRFRVVHLVMMEIVALEGAFGVLCPMTTWEEDLRKWAGAIDTATSYVEPKPRTETPPTPETTEPPKTEPAKTQTPPRVDPEPMPKAPPVESKPPMKVEQPPPSQPPPMRDPEPTPPTQQTGPPPPVMPAGEGGATSEEDKESTFVGRLLHNILFLEISQTVLDRWYERFGYLTLLLFVLFPPRFPGWTRCGLTGVILLWVGTLYGAAAFFDWKVAQGKLLTSNPAAPLPAWYANAGLITGMLLVVVGLACAWRGCGQCCEPEAPARAA